MAQNEPHWIEIAIRNPILTGFVGAGLFVSILMLTNDVRKRLFIDKVEIKGETVTQELRAIRDEYRELVKAQREFIDDLNEDNTDLRKTLKEKTQPLPDISDERENE